MKQINVSESAHTEVQIEKAKRGGTLSDAVDRIIENHREIVELKKNAEEDEKCKA